LGLLDRFRPPSGLAHPDASQRLRAVDQVTESELALLAPVVRGDAEARVRRAAARRLRDPRLLGEVAASDADASVREAAIAVLLGVALEGRDETAGLAALEGLFEARHLTTVARSAALESISRAALQRLADQRSLGSVARHGEHEAVRAEALGQITDAGELALVARKSGHKEIAIPALDRVTDPAALEEIASRARCRAAARRARARLRGQDVDEADETARPATDRAAQEALCEAAESVARSDDWEDLPTLIARLQDRWIEEIPEVDEDLDERFQRACRSARQRLAAWQAERAAEERRERAVAQAMAPRLELCERVESCAAESAPRVVEEARSAWEILSSFDSPESAEAETRFQAACRAAQERHARSVLDLEEAKARTRAEESAREDARRRKENAARLEKLCEQVAKVAAAQNAPLAKLERGLRDVRAAVLDLPPLPSPKDHENLAGRLRALQADLLPRVQGLREADRFQRWANAAVQEELCARMEDLARSTEEPEADAGTAARGLRDLMEQWKAAGPAPPERSLALWNRFKTARDRVRERCDAFHALQVEEQVKNLALKEALCEKAEALSDSTDWLKTTEAIQTLQAEWKAIGPVSRGHEKSSWERFRKACDVFFTRRQEDLIRRKEEWSKNLTAKQALCERAEALSESRDWKVASAEIKKLQSDWKAIGPVKRSQSEAIWSRFRGACDRFFENFKNRDAIERQVRIAEREALCSEVEALVPHHPPVETGAEAPADPGPAGTSGDGAAPEGLVGRLREALERWQRMRGLSHEAAATLHARFYGAFDRVLQAFPGAVQGTSLDPSTNRRRMEELCARVEKVAAGRNLPPENGDLSPAARLAAQWREALASNTMGGRVAEESRIRAAAEEIKKAQAAWQRLGYVPEADRRALAERFERACRPILQHAAVSSRASGGGRGAGERQGSRHRG
jgi:hypothetical protein